MMNQIKHIRLDKLLPPTFDARLTTSPEADEELQNSIRHFGILEPLLVKATSTGFEIIAGHRRFTAAGVIGLQAAPCIVMKVTGADSEAIKIHENLHRLAPSDIDQASTYKYLVDTYDMTEKQVSELTGKSIPYISQHLSLLHSEPVLVKAVQDGKIHFTAARELMLIKNKDEQRRLSSIAAENGVTSEIARNWKNEANLETAILNGDETPPIPSETQPKYHEPTFPCQLCDVTHRIAQMQVLKVCPACREAIEYAISHQVAAAGS